MNSLMDRIQSLENNDGEKASQTIQNGSNTTNQG